MINQLVYRMSPSWHVKQIGKVLYLHGGADAEYVVELKDDGPSRFVKKMGNFVRSELHSADNEVFDQLWLAGIVEFEKREPLKKLKFFLMGDVLPMSLKGKNISEVRDHLDADVIVICRYTSWHGKIIKKTDYYTIDQPHLYADFAYHHTVSLGPLVYPGQTSCIGCLYGRLKQRWGDEKPPSKPLALQSNNFISSWLGYELCRIARGDMTLVGKTISMDIENRSMQHDLLLKSASCPRCGSTSS